MLTKRKEQKVSEIVRLGLRKNPTGEPNVVKVSVRREI
jgi:hypothetical protein